jgi:hypothetical protein
MGVGFVLRKTAASLKPTVTITNEGDNWKISTVTTFRSLEVSFVDGVEFEEGKIRLLKNYFSVSILSKQKKNYF